MNKADMSMRRGSVSTAKIIIYGAVIFLLTVFQTTVASRFGFFGTTPALALALTCGAACFENERTGAVVGLSAGFCADALGNSGISLLPIIYVLVGWFGAGLAEKLGQNRNKNSFGAKLLIWTLMLAAGCGVCMISTSIGLLLTAGKLHIISAIVGILLPEALSTFVFGYPIGLIYLLVYRKRNK